MNNEEIFKENIEDLLKEKRAYLESLINKNYESELEQNFKYNDLIKDLKDCLCLLEETKKKYNACLFNYCFGMSLDTFLLFYNWDPKMALFINSLIIITSLKIFYDYYKALFYDYASDCLKKEKEEICFNTTEIIYENYKNRKLNKKCTLELDKVDNNIKFLNSLSDEEVKKYLSYKM